MCSTPGCRGTCFSMKTFLGCEGENTSEDTVHLSVSSYSVLAKSINILILMVEGTVSPIFSLWTFYIWPKTLQSFSVGEREGDRDKQIEGKRNGNKTAIVLV